MCLFWGTPQSNYALGTRMTSSVSENGKEIFIFIFLLGHHMGMKNLKCYVVHTRMRMCWFYQLGKIVNCTSAINLSHPVAFIIF